MELLGGVASLGPLETLSASLTPCRISSLVTSNPWSFPACILHCSVDVSLSNCNVSTWVRKLSRRTLNKIHTNKTSSLYEFCEWLIFNYMYLMWQVVDQSRFLSGLSIRIIIHSDQLSNFLIWKISHFFSQSSTPKFRKEWTLHGKESFFNCFFFCLRL